MEPEGDPLGPFPASHDLLGDGTLSIVPDAGPYRRVTSRCSSAGTGRTWLLAGDLAHDLDELERVRPEIARWCEAERIELLTAHDVAAPVADGP